MNAGCECVPLKGKNEVIREQRGVKDYRCYLWKVGSDRK